VVEGADRFGLAQLHQLRGRVGRGTAQSACVLIADAKEGSAAERLEALASTSDGMALAELDLKLRGPGDFFGLRQSGEVDRYRFARHAPLSVLHDAQRVAAELLAESPDLEQADMAALRERVARFSAAAGRI